MPEAALALLFASCGLFALGVIAQSWRRHGAQALAVHGQLETCSATRTFTYRIVSHDVMWRPKAKIFAFPARERFNPVPQPLRAAA